MADFKIWDVIKVPFPYTNRPVLQRRPALVVSTVYPIGAPTLLWVLMVTSATHRRWDGDVLISNLAEAGLPAASMVRSAKIATIEAADAEVLGHLPAPDRVTIATILQERLPIQDA